MQESMEKLDWEYIRDILVRATRGMTGCPPELFDAYEALQKLDAGEWGNLDATELELQRTIFTNFHKHSAILYDLGFIEIWDSSLWRYYSRALVFNIYGDEFLAKARYCIRVQFP